MYQVHNMPTCVWRSCRQEVKKHFQKVKILASHIWYLNKFRIWLVVCKVFHYFKIVFPRTASAHLWLSGKQMDHTHLTTCVCFANRYFVMKETQLLSHQKWKKLVITNNCWQQSNSQYIGTILVSDLMYHTQKFLKLKIAAKKLLGWNSHNGIDSHDKLFCLKDGT